MNRSVTLRRPDGQTGSYGGWLTAEAGRWLAASAEERAASQLAARERHADLNKARAQAPNGNGTVVLVYDEIGFWGITAADLVADLHGISGDIELHLNTPGGDVFDGIAIANALKQRDGLVTIVVDGLAASIGSVIAMAADPGRLVMAPNATMMIHEAWGMCIGSAADMAEMQGLLDDTSGNIASIYAARSGKSAAEWRDVMKAESWMIGQQAVDAGLADFMQGAPGAVASAPASVQGYQVVVTPEPDLDGLIAAAIRADRHLRNASVDESAWDGPAAMSAASKADDPAAALSAICAGTKAGDPKTQAAHALPHHKHQGDPPNRSGVSAALGRIDSTQDLTNKAAAEAHLNAHKAAMPDASNHAELPAWLQQDAKEAADR